MKIKVTGSKPASEWFPKFFKSLNPWRHSPFLQDFQLNLEVFLSFQKLRGIKSVGLFWSSGVSYFFRSCYLQSTGSCIIWPRFGECLAAFLSHPLLTSLLSWPTACRTPTRAWTQLFTPSFRKPSAKILSGRALASTSATPWVVSRPIRNAWSPASTQSWEIPTPEGARQTQEKTWRRRSCSRVTRSFLPHRVATTDPTR